MDRTSVFLILSKEVVQSLRTARCEEFKTEEGRKKAANILSLWN